MLSSNHAFIIENDIPANRHKGDYVFGVWQFSYVMYIFTRHGHWHDARDQLEYPWSVFEIVGLFDHESPLKTLANRLDSDQARNFDKVTNCLKLWRIHELGPKIFLKRSLYKSLQIHVTSVSMQSWYTSMLT